jgi:hypothetical protein
MFIGTFRALTPKGVPTSHMVRGAIAGGMLWTVLQVIGTYLVHDFLHSDSVYGVSATVLGRCPCPAPPQTATGRSEAASSRSPVQVAWPVTTTGK